MSTTLHMQKHLYVQWQEKGPVFWDQSCSIEYNEPTVAVTAKTREKYTKAADQMESFVGHHSGTDKCLRQKMAGNRSVSGTDVKAPTKATKSVKNGMAFATVYAVIAMSAVSTTQRMAGLNESGNQCTRCQSKRSILLQMACELMA